MLPGPGRLRRVPRHPPCRQADADHPAHRQGAGIGQDPRPRARRRRLRDQAVQPAGTARAAEGGAAPSRGDVPQVYRFGDIEVESAACDVRREGQPVDLTTLEFKLLSHFIRRRGHVLSRTSCSTQSGAPAYTSPTAWWTRTSRTCARRSRTTRRSPCTSRASAASATASMARNWARELHAILTSPPNAAGARRASLPSAVAVPRSGTHCAGGMP